jgi:hypothetical protein
MELPQNSIFRLKMQYATIILKENVILLEIEPEKAKYKIDFITANG